VRGFAPSRCRFRWRTAGTRAALLAPLLLVSCATVAEAREARVSTPVTEILFAAGPGQPSTRFFLRGARLLLLSPSAEDGGAAGLFAAALPKQDPLVAALAGLPETVAGPPPVPGMPTVQFVYQQDGAHPARRLVVARPALDARVDKAVRELQRCEAAARRHPLMTIALDLRAEPTRKAAGPAARAPALVATLLGRGETSFQARLRPGAVVLEAAPDVGPPQPGVTSLPPEWEQVSAPASAPSTETLKPGDVLHVPLSASLSASGPRHVRASFEDTVELRGPGLVESVPVALTSRALALTGDSVGKNQK
jgi:hypothetical protein